MRALFVLLPLACLGACLPDRDDAEVVRPAAGSVTPRHYACDGPIGKGLVAGFHPDERIDYVAWRTEHFSVDMRPPSTVTVNDESGAPNARASALIDELRYCDEERCPKTDYPQVFDGTAWRLYCSGSAKVGGREAGGFTVSHLVIARGDDVSLVTTRDELVSFFGTIDTKAEAVFLALRDGFSRASCNYGGIEERDDGYAIRIPVLGGCERAPDGPARGSEEIVLVVGRDGHTRIDSRETLPDGVLGESE